MSEKLSHRGPDDQGHYVSPDGEIFLGHRRLSIIDLSSVASQPMSSLDKRYWIAFNGEIYNHMPLRKELLKEGLHFKTDHSDTETILQGYIHWGKEVVNKLDGMFAFAIWDDTLKTLFLARDRMGIKPLYYSITNNQLTFSSEIKALLENPFIKKEMDPEAFSDCLTFLVSPAPKTLFKNIFKISSSTTMTVKKGSAPVFERFWDPFHGSFDSTLSETDLINKTRTLLEKSVSDQMMSDVDFGVFLSGGIDSSCNVAMMSKILPTPVRTYSIGYESKELADELPSAQRVAKLFHTNHHEARLNENHFREVLERLIYFQDEPITDPVCIPLYYVAQLAGTHNTKVCLVGEGSDELFCGYPHWKRHLLYENIQNNFLKWIPKGLLEAGNKSLLTFTSGDRARRIHEKIRRHTSGESLFWGGAEAFSGILKEQILSREFSRSLNGYASYQHIKRIKSDFDNAAPDHADTLQWMTYLDLRLRLPELILMRVDKMTMASGIEARVPFLDHRLVEFLIQLPMAIRFKGRELKYLLKKALLGIIPPDILYRPKQGFTHPLDVWFSQELHSWGENKIHEFSKRTPYFNRHFLETYTQQTSQTMRWFLINIILWHEYWIEGKKIGI